MTIPYMQDNRPAVLLPKGSRYTTLAMLQAHNKAHVGVEAMVVQFRMDGNWTVRDGQLAKKIRARCVICRYLNKPLLGH